MICYPLPTSFVLETCFSGKNEVTCNIYLQDLHFSFYIVIDYRSKAMFQEKKGLTNLHTSKNVKNFGHVAFRIEVFFVLRPEFAPILFKINYSRN